MKNNFWRLVFISTLVWSMMVVGFLAYKTKYRPLKINLSAENIQKYREWKPPVKGVLVVGSPISHKRGRTLATGDSGASVGVLRAYVKAEATAKGINPELADCIIQRESQYDPKRKGPDSGNTISRGLWQINDYYHKEVSDKIAYDYKLATEWSLNWIKSGHIKQWSTYKDFCSQHKVFLK